MDKVISINLTGVWLCARVGARQMMKQNPVGGKIINTASMVATITSDGDGSCNEVGLTRTLAAQWGAHNINVHCFSPSHTMTPNESYNSPEDVRLFYSHRASDYVTGHDLMVDGGHALNTWPDRYCAQCRPPSARRRRSQPWSPISPRQEKQNCP